MKFLFIPFFFVFRVIFNRISCGVFVLWWKNCSFPGLFSVLRQKNGLFLCAYRGIWMKFRLFFYSCQKDCSFLGFLFVLRRKNCFFLCDFSDVWVKFLFLIEKNCYMFFFCVVILGFLKFWYRNWSELWVYSRLLVLSFFLIEYWISVFGFLMADFFFFDIQELLMCAYSIYRIGMLMDMIDYCFGAWYIIVLYSDMQDFFVVL